MTPTLPPQAARAVERLRRAFAPERIVLFGSYAKCTNHDGSDIDLLLIADLAGDPAIHRRRAQQLTADCFPPIDVVFHSLEDVAEAEIARSPFLLSVLEKGITLFSRAPGARLEDDRERA
jgi:predicted nucleotidyltransferase